MTNLLHFKKRFELMLMGFLFLSIVQSCDQTLPSEDCNLPAPQNLTATFTGDAGLEVLNVSWNAVSGATDYRLTVKTPDGTITILDSITTLTSVNNIDIDPPSDNGIYDIVVTPRCANAEESINSSSLRVGVPIIIDIIADVPPPTGIDTTGFKAGCNQNSNAMIFPQQHSNPSRVSFKADFVNGTRIIQSKDWQLR